MSSVRGSSSLSNDDAGDDLQQASLFNGQDTNGNDSANSKEEKFLMEHRNSIEEVDWLQVKRPSDVGCDWLTSSAPSEHVKVLLVFPQDDRQSELLSLACDQLGWRVSGARDAERALDLFQAHYHEVVVVDRRGLHCQPADDICRALNNVHHRRATTILALVKCSFFVSPEQHGQATLRILDAGYNRALVESSSKEILTNELIGIYANEVQPKQQLAVAHSLYLAVHRCRDMVHVTNDRHSIQLQKGHEFHGNMNCKRKSNGTITISSKIIPFCAYGKRVTHHVYIYDTTYLLENFEVSHAHQPHPMAHLHPRGSSHSLRSFDVASINSDLQRRSSVAKLHNLPLEAPITKVITLLHTAMTDTVNPDVATQIDKAIEILKTTELYAPYVREDDELFNDPVASDLIGALISAPQYARDSRRSSNDSSGRISQVQRILHQQPSKLTSKSLRVPRDIEVLLETCWDWSFDIFKLELLSGRRPLYYLGMHVMNAFEAPSHLNCSERTLQNWLTVVEVNYNANNSYHNSTHAADVLQAIARFMRSEKLKVLLDPLDEIAALIAAAAHDIDHPGKSSQFLCNSANKLAILYNDLSVLESHHAALTFKLTLSDDDVNIFKNLDTETYKILRQNIIDMILATEMTKHFEHLAKFVNVCSIRTNESPSEPFSDQADSTVLMLPDNVSLVKRMMIKCADVSNPTRPLRYCIEWTKRIAEEYFRQTDEEKRKNLPVVMPMFDRATCSIPKSQIGFVDFIINDMMEAWNAFIDLPEIIDYMKQNYESWKEYNERGISTLQDVEKLQQSPDLQIPQST
ncbi:high affinity cAMP-specific and IBMX-insensitive 3',5'-cyclic phosphodiesterase 8 isoform X2 [Phymastichus coffea]|uniref:high affinity cAMP-specific and IBMX-insensitive 3',5'-cyclic phosphodiesterase 8 isoform X2 n=1 Tax=Phymastichus coffea TaxID=108790 RepID=UPI00273B9B93|nr:high affinity cAMP-specific and IBMX-insensitive 3',5'-cyclic phosphodiesterase 8 isoform X2 [Phymastichus coffea]